MRKRDKENSPQLCEIVKSEPIGKIMSPQKKINYLQD